MIDTALANDAGVFVLALTSNPEGPQVQHAMTADGRPVGRRVLDALAARNAGAAPLGSFGAVVGATIGETSRRTSTSTAPCWCPGVGAQGGTVDDVRRIFGPAVRNVLPSSSREILPPAPTEPHCARPPSARLPSWRLSPDEAQVLRSGRRLLVTGPLTGCSDDDKGGYCDALRAKQVTHQARRPVGSQGPGLPDRCTRAVRAAAGCRTRGLRDEWDTVVFAWSDLVDALDGADTTRREFDPGKRPDGVSAAEFAMSGTSLPSSHPPASSTPSPASTTTRARPATSTCPCNGAAARVAAKLTVTRLRVSPEPISAKIARSRLWPCRELTPEQRQANLEKAAASPPGTGRGQEPSEALGRLHPRRAQGGPGERGHREDAGG